MNAEQLANAFYTAFAAKDHATMRPLYAANATFHDPVFELKGQNDIGDMWEMLCTRGKDLVLKFEILRADEKRCTVKWEPTYTFSKTDRKVENIITASLVVENGKIVEHLDRFDFKRWSKQALGASGRLLPTKFLQKKVQATALEGLIDFQQKE